jgi:ABC-2 type transport system ATP-binding protein
MTLAHDNTVPVIRTENLTKVFGRFKAVDDVTLSIARGEIFGLLGPNGAGKSTTIRMLCGLLSSTSGTAQVGGFDINRDPEKVRENIGYMSQKFSLYRDLTVLENLLFFGGVYGVEDARLHARANTVLAETGLSEHKDQITGTLSGAIQQRLALASAILHEPVILFLDEPTSGVDPISRRTFWDLIREMALRGVTILVTTHFMDEAEFCGRIGFISGGRLIAMDSPSGIKRTSVDEDLFEVIPGETTGAKERIEKLDGVWAVSYFGTRLHVFCRRGAHTDASLLNLLRGDGLDVRSAKMIPVTLEDAFVRLAQKGN